MKKLLFVLVMVMSVLAVNAQATKTTAPSSEKKTTTTTTTTTMAPAASATMKVSDLPKAVSDNIAKSYPGYTVKEAKSEKNGAEYKVMLEKGTSKETLTYDKEGKLLKSSAKSESKEPKK